MNSFDHGHADAEGADAASSAAAPARPTANAPLKRDLIAGLEKGLSVIAAFDQDRPRLTMSEVAGLCNLTRAAARRYLITLEHLGYVTSDRKMYALTPKVLRLGQSYMHSARLPRIAQPLLYRLAYSLGEAASVGVLDHDQLVCVAAVSAGQLVSATLQPGTRVPAYCTANGRVLLSALAPADAEAWISKQNLAPLTPHTITQAERLKNELARIRTQGYAAVDQELELGLRTISVPLKSYRGDVLAAMNISVHAARVTMDQLVSDCLPALLQAQASLRTVL